MFVGRLDVSGNHLHVLFKILGKLFVLLVAPSDTQRIELCDQGRQLLLQLLVEFLLVLRKSPQFNRVNDGLRHGSCSDADRGRPLEIGGFTEKQGESAGARRARQSPDNYKTLWAQRKGFAPG